MKNLKDIVQRGREGPALMFREKPYDLDNPDDLLADITALANADIVGQRALIVGVSTGEPGKRRMPGLARDTVPDASILWAIIEKYIEPVLSMQVLAPGHGDKTLLVILLDRCDDPPYVMKRSCGVLLKGAGFIRSGDQNIPLSREEGARLRARAAAEPVADRPKVAANPESGNALLALTFPDGQRVSSLAAAPDDNLPSLLATMKLNGAIKARKEVQAMSGLDTGIVRLMHVRAFGQEQPFARKSIEELEDDLRSVRETFAVEDEFYLFEKAAPRLNFKLCNRGDRALKNVTLLLRIQCIPGFEVVPCIYATDIDQATRRHVLRETESPGYPAVQREDYSFEIRRALRDIEKKSEALVFEEPLRIVVRPPAENQTVLVSYELNSASLNTTVKGTLKLELKAAPKS